MRPPDPPSRAGDLLPSIAPGSFLERARIQPPLRVLICGDRNWGNRKTGNHLADAGTNLAEIDAIRLYVSTLPGDSIVIEGEARGADTIARQAAEDYGLTVEPYPAYWDQHGRAAGPVRNHRMLSEGHPDVVVYFHHDLRLSAGTKHMVHIANKKHVEVIDGMRYLRERALL